ncbi:HupE/UreJ family protein [Rhodobacterales bacterium]|nr:HupE/UreJ family protein [Rhodobacterales bacterium]
MAACWRRANISDRLSSDARSSRAGASMRHVFATLSGPRPGTSRKWSWARRLMARAFFMSLVLASGFSARAHFSEGMQVRTILVTSLEGDLRVFVRSPAPLIFSDLIGRSQVEEIPLVSPFLLRERTGDGERYSLDMDTIDEDRRGFGMRLNKALIFSQSGLDLPARLVRFQVHSARPAREIAEGSFEETFQSDPVPTRTPAFGTAVVDFELVMESPDPSGLLTVRSGYEPLVTGPGISIDNHLLDVRRVPPASLTVPGQLETPVLIGGSRLQTFVRYVYQGVLHIVEGLDHVLLVIAMALGVGATRKLVYLVTAFTVGHSATLVLTFLGATPTWPWFIPLVETAIAASVLYAAAAALLQRSGSVAVFAGIGLLHGLGFSFVLRNILGREAPDLVAALIAFNIGIEVGQLLILALTLSVVFLLSRYAAPALRPARLGALAGIALMSGWWVSERLSSVVASV